MDVDKPRENISQNTDLRDTVVNQANHITRLEVENRHLRAQLVKHNAISGAALAANTISDGNLSTPVAKAQLDDQTALLGTELSSNSFDELRNKYEDLVARHQQLTSTFEEHKQWVDHATKKYKAAKMAIKEWKHYLENQKRNMQARVVTCPPESHSHSHSKDAETIDDNAAPRARPSQSPAFLTTSYERENRDEQRADLPVNATPGFQQVEDGNATTAPQGFTRVVDLATSSQTTEGDVDGPVNSTKTLGAPYQQSDDEPQVVAARSLKRKRPSTPARASPSRRIKREFSSQDVAIEVNSEDYSSPPKARQTFVRTETSDLSTVMHIATTPHKHLKFNDEAQRARSEELLTLKPPLDHDASLSDDGVQHRSRRKCGTSPRALKSARQDFDRELPAVRARYSAAPGPEVQREALMPLSSNLLASPHAQVPRSNRGKGYRMAANVSEDGAILSSQHPGFLDDAPPKANNNHNERLDDMLITKPQESKPILKPRQILSVKKPAAALVTPPPAANQPTQSRINRNHAPAEASPPPVKPEDEPLRLRSVNQLRLEDFKVNAKYMDSSFAFADSLRKRDQKRCAPGCTNPACCGNAFRDLAAMAGSDLFQSSDKMKNDAELLEEYLGPEWEANIGALSPEQREETLVTARAWALSNQHGKHRQAFERRSTPPGFWRTDFPSTQETLEDRARAHEMLRQKVEERYREAMRPGGRWKFRDE